MTRQCNWSHYSTGQLANLHTDTAPCFHRSIGTRSSGDYAGTRGIWLRNTHDTLVASFYIRNPTKRDVLLTNMATGNVIANGAGADLAMDAYGGSVYGNLYTSMNIGAVSRAQGMTGVWLVTSACIIGPALALHDQTWSTRVA